MPMTIYLSLMPSSCTADIILHSDCADHYLISSFATGRVQSPHFLVLSIIYLLPLYVCSSFAPPVSVRLAFCFYVSSLMLSCLTWCSWTLFFDFLSRHKLYASPCTLLWHSSLRFFASGLALVRFIIFLVDCFLYVYFWVCRYIICSPRVLINREVTLECKRGSVGLTYTDK